MKQLEMELHQKDVENATLRVVIEKTKASYESSIHVLESRMEEEISNNEALERQINLVRRQMEELSNAHASEISSLIK